MAALLSPLSVTAADAQSRPTDFEALLPQSQTRVGSGTWVERIDPDGAFTVQVFAILPKRRMTRETVHPVAETKKYAEGLPDHHGRKFTLTFAADEGWTIDRTTLKIREASGMYRFRSKPARDRTSVDVEMILRTGTSTDPRDAWLYADIVIIEEREAPAFKVLQDRIDVLVGGEFVLDGEPLAPETAIFLYDQWNDPLGYGGVEQPFYIGRLDLYATVTNTPRGPALKIAER